MGKINDGLAKPQNGRRRCGYALIRSWKRRGLWKSLPPP